jgi:hypothetical protein
VSLVPEEGEESSVRVHSLLLSAASPYLAGLLGGAGEHTVCLPGSLADPYPHVFGPPGSGSINERYGSGSGFGSGSESGSFNHHAKIVRKTSDSYYFVTFYL